MSGKLRVLELADRFYQLTKSKRLPHGLGAQLGRAASSVALNLMEGWGRKSDADRNHFFTVALGSIRECQAIVGLEKQKFTPDELKLLDHLAAGTYLLARPKTTSPIPAPRTPIPPTP